MNKGNYTEINSKTIDKWAEGGWEWAIPITHEEYINAKQGQWKVVLTPLKPVPKKWFPKLEGAKLLGLASGGGQQMPIFAALGAECTVFDYSQKQLDSEKLVAEREGYSINIVRGDMTKTLPFADNSFDIIFHPVSNCYIEDVCHVWNECFRVLKKGGVLLAGMDNGLNFLFGDDQSSPLVVKYKLPFNPLKASDEEFQQMVDNYEGIQFSHTAEEQIGGQLKAGLVLTDLFEDSDNSLLGQHMPLFIATRAIKP